MIQLVICFNGGKSDSVSNFFNGGKSDSVSNLL